MAKAKSTQPAEAPVVTPEVETVEETPVIAEVVAPKLELSPEETALICLMRSARTMECNGFDVRQGKPFRLRVGLQIIDFNDPETVKKCIEASIVSINLS